MAVDRLYEAGRLTDTIVKGLPAPTVGNRIKRDTEVRGFGIRVTAGGARAFVLNYRFEGRERRITIGSYPDWSTIAARERAKELRRAVDSGEDPLARREERRAAATMSELCARYEAEHLPTKRPGSQYDDRLMIKRSIKPALGNMKVAHVTVSDIERLHQGITNRGTPIRANRVVALLSKMFSLAVAWSMRADNPVSAFKKLKRNNTEAGRERYLSLNEIGRLAEALDRLPDQASANAIRLLMLTGARRGEVLSAQWSDFDLAARVWTKPASRTKQKKQHRVALSGAVIALLTEIGPAVGPLFPGRRGNETQAGVKGSWKAVCKVAGIEGVRLHDLRHTFASLLVSDGLSLPLIGSLLGHSSSATTARYAHLHQDPQREAAERIGVLFSGLAAAKRT